MSCAVRSTICGRVIGILPPKLQLIIIVRQKHVREAGIRSRAGDAGASQCVWKVSVRCPGLAAKVVNQFVDEIVAVPVIQLEHSVIYRHICPVPSFIATGSQADAGTFRRFDVQVSERPAIPISCTICINRFLQYT